MTDADTTTIPSRTRPSRGGPGLRHRPEPGGRDDRPGAYVYLLHQQVAMLAARCSMLEAQVQTLAWQLKGASPQ